MKKILVFALMFVMIAIVPAWAADLNNPTGFSLSATSTTITVHWTAVNPDDQEIEGFMISYKKSDVSSDDKIVIEYSNPSATSYTITGLAANTKYEVILAVFNGADVSTGKGDTITTTDLDISITLVDQGTIEIDISKYKDTVNTYDVKIGTSPGSYDSSLEQTGIDVEEKATISGLSNGTYYILVEYEDTSGDDKTADEIQFEVADFGTFFSQAGDIEEGCFIGASSGSALTPWVMGGLIIPALWFLARNRKTRLFLCSLFLMLTVFSSSARCEQHENVSYNNLFGIKGGYFDPEQSFLGETYDSIIPVSLFYERMFGRYFSMDVSAGYTRASGNAITTSGNTTGVETQLDFIPISASMNLNLPITDVITCYIGAGGDYWSFEEGFNDVEYKTDIGGYHGKVGFKLFTEDSEYFKRGAVLIEASYSVMDRFGENEIDLGGWTYSIGTMYCF